MPRRKPKARRRRTRRAKPWSDSARARDVMVERWRGAAMGCAVRISRARGSVMPRDELESAAACGLLQAVDKFDPERGAEFGTYLYHKVRSEVLDRIRFETRRAGRSRVRFHSLDMMEQQRRSAAAIDGRRGGDSASREYAARVGLSAASDSAALRLTEAPERETAAERSERGEIVALAMLALRNHPRLRRVVKLYFYKGKTLREVGTRMGFSEQRAMQLVHRALRMMRQDLDARGISEEDTL